jgi:hypothetical protein
VNSSLPKKSSKIAKNREKTPSKRTIHGRKTNLARRTKTSTLKVSKKKNNQGKLGSSFDSWLNVQVWKRMKHPSSEPAVKVHLAPPADTFDSWLRKQPVVEKESVLSSNVVVRTYEDWISKQVAAKKLEPEQERSNAIIENEEVSTADEMATTA